MNTGEIWIWAGTLEAGRHVKKVFDEANFLNPVVVIANGFDCHAFFQAGQNLPMIILLDLGIPQGRAWEVLASISGTKAEEEVSFVALVDDSTEILLDRAYDAGVKTYLRKPLTFAQFLERARMLNLEFILARPGAN